MPSGQIVTAAVTVDGASAGITNTIIAGHVTGILLLSGTAHQNFNLFDNVITPTAGGVTGGGDSLTGAAAFVDAAGGDYRITPGSDARDMGTNAGVLVDFFGVPRPTGAGFDIGYHEYEPRRLFLPLIVR